MKGTIWDGALYPDHEGSKAAKERSAAALTSCDRSLSLVLHPHFKSFKTTLAAWKFDFRASSS